MDLILLILLCHWPHLSVNIEDRSYHSAQKQAKHVLVIILMKKKPTR